MLLYFHTFWPCQLQIGHKFEFYLFALLQDIYIHIYVYQIYAVMFPRESSFSLELIITCDRFCELIKIAYVNITF